MGERSFSLAILGCGRWGVNHVRTASKLFGSELKVVADPERSASEKVKAISESIKFSDDTRSVIHDPGINAAIVATPAETHYSVSKELLLQGKNVLVEKPISLHIQEARELNEIAESRKLKLMVGHVLLYHPAVLRMKEMIKAGKIGNLQYIYSNRLNLGTVRSEENILWSFAPHDISVMQFLTESNPVFVDANGASFLQRDIEDTTLTYLTYPGNVHAHIHVSWLHPFKEQRMVVIGTEGMIVFEDSAAKDKLRIYPKGFRSVNGTLEKFDGEYEVVPFEQKQPLAEEQLHFRECILNDTRPLTDGVHATEVLAILEKAERSLKKNA